MFGQVFTAEMRQEIEAEEGDKFFIDAFLLGDERKVFLFSYVSLPPSTIKATAMLIDLKQFT
jgi:hypothetical protein